MFSEIYVKRNFSYFQCVFGCCEGAFFCGWDVKAGFPVLSGNDISQKVGGRCHPYGLGLFADEFVVGTAPFRHHWTLHLSGTLRHFLCGIG